MLSYYNNLGFIFFFSNSYKVLEEIILNFSVLSVAKLCFPSDLYMLFLLPSYSWFICSLDSISFIASDLFIFEFYFPPWVSEFDLDSLYESGLYDSFTLSPFKGDVTFCMEFFLLINGKSIESIYCLSSFNAFSILQLVSG